ncbi:hypothetical protein [Thalassotalea eurytherma]|uniref:Uncharacterized protein n=1 Tax=Thalassotalea eurytherma TaxID=1144278 RepID=A0ABQ6H3T1_9GAMM|nr:hypothetical protein [Thalassotalea eurytherma]GLX81096.1 hypothetical protein theurythT_05480 [Thalassotalea eurytherma]
MIMLAKECADYCRNAIASQEIKAYFSLRKPNNQYEILNQINNFPLDEQKAVYDVLARYVTS